MKPSCLPVLVLGLCAGCRSDGGVGRQDSARGMEFSTGRVASRFEGDCRRTKYLISSIPSAIAAAFTEGPENMRNTYHLYLETHEER